MKNKSQAFTLIELLVVVSIIAILAALIIAGAGKVLRSSSNAKCVSNLKQLALTASLYAQENNGSLPTVDFNYFQELYPIAYPSVKPGDVPVVAGGKPFPPEMLKTIFACPAMDAKIVNSRGFAINTDLRTLYRPEPLKNTDIRVLKIEELSKTALFSDTHATSSMSSALTGQQAKVMERHGHINVAYCDGHVAQVQPDDPEVKDRSSTFWTGR